LYWKGVLARHGKSGQPSVIELNSWKKKSKAKQDTFGTTRNAVHDPFTYKFPPEIASRILQLSLPTLNNGEHEQNALHEQWRAEWATPLTLGSVYRQWRQLTWATPHLCTALYLKIYPFMMSPTAELLPGLLHEWLGRSGAALDHSLLS